MKHEFLVVLALLPAWVHAQAPAGPHAVGFRVIEHWDRTRVPAPPLDFRGEATDAPQATPMLVGVWYPARPTNGAPIRDVDYRLLQQRRETLGAPRAGDREAAAAGLKSIAQFGLGLELDDAAIAAALERPLSAVRDAEPAAGVFPLVLGGLEGPAAAAPLAEIRNDVLAAYQQERGAAAAKAAADKVLAQTKRGTQIGAALASLGVALPPVQGVAMGREQLGAMGQQPPPPLVLLFSMAMGTTKLLPAPNNAGWFVVSLKDIVPGTIAPNDPLIASAQRELGTLAGQEYSQQLARAIRAELGVKREDAAIKALRSQLAGGN